jgi:hypothetical protein
MLSMLLREVTHHFIVFIVYAQPESNVTSGFTY